MSARILYPVLALAAVAGLAACSNGGHRYGYSRATVGIGYGAPYYGWYDGFYYPAPVITCTTATVRAIAGVTGTGAIGKVATIVASVAKTGAATTIAATTAGAAGMGVGVRS